MEKKNIDWSNLGFGYIQTELRYVSCYKEGAWDEGTLTGDANVVLNECAGVLQYAQTIFEGLKDLDAILPEQMPPREREALNRYHRAVYEKISPYLTGEEKTWLAEATAEV